MTRKNRSINPQGYQFVYADSFSDEEITKAGKVVDMAKKYGVPVDFSTASMWQLDLNLLTIKAASYELNEMYKNSH